MKEKKKSEIFNKIRPLGNRALIKPVETGGDVHKKTASGIFIPENLDREKGELGTVLAVGEGNYENGKLVPMKVRVGDKIIFSKYGYEEIKLDEKKYFILKEENILAVIK